MCISHGMKCPECGEELLLRLGMLECSGCGHEMPLPVDEPDEDDEGRPLVRRESWQLAKGKAIEVSTGQDSVTFKQGLRDMADDRKDGRDLEARELGIEKVIVLILLLGIGILNVYSCYADQDIIMTALALPWVGMVLIEVVRLGLTLMVFYYPFVPLKWAGIGITSLGILICLANLFFLANNRDLILHGLPIGLNTYLLGVNSWMQYCINIIIFIAILGVLGRDVQKTHM